MTDDERVELEDEKDPEPSQPTDEPNDDPDTPLARTDEPKD